MDKLRALHYLLKVADTLSFSRTAQAFGVPASSISRRIADLEAELGVELLHRTTRTVRLTEVGTLYVEQVRQGIAQLNDADDLVGRRGSTPSGTLRISAMPSYGKLLLMPALQDFGDPDLLLRGGEVDERALDRHRVADPREHVGNGVGQHRLTSSPSSLRESDRRAPCSGSRSGTA